MFGGEAETLARTTGGQREKVYVLTQLTKDSRRKLLHATQNAVWLHNAFLNEAESIAELRNCDLNIVLDFLSNSAPRRVTVLRSQKSIRHGFSVRSHSNRETVESSTIHPPPFGGRKKELSWRGEENLQVKECCDRCGLLLGPVRFTRRGEAGIWCGRECRGDGDRRTIRKGGRPRKYKTERDRRQAERRQNAERQKAFREESRVTENPLAALLKQKTYRCKKHISRTTPLPGLFRPGKRAFANGSTPLTMATPSKVATVQPSPTPRFDASDILTPAQLAERLQVSPSWIFEQTRKQGQGSATENPHPCIRLGKYLRFSWVAVCEWMAQNNG